MFKEIDIIYIQSNLTSYKEIFLEFFKNYPNLNLLTVENNYASLSTNENSTKSYSLHITVEEHKGESINKKIWFELYHSEVGVNILNLGTLGTNMRDELRPIVLGLKFEIENFEKTAPASDIEIINEKITKSENPSKIDNLQKSSISFQSDKLPIFLPSEATKPEGFTDSKELISNFKYALFNPSTSIQSFFNDLDFFISHDSFVSVNDEILNLPPFDEAYYCALVKQMHQYSLAELRDKNEEEAQRRSKSGAIAGILLGILSGNPLAPFYGAHVGSNIGRNSIPRTKKIEEILPDPKLLFLKDNYSYLSISRSQTPKVRRIIFAPIKDENGNIYFRIIPAIVTLDYVLPMQVFKIGINEYFLRPVAAGILRSQRNYDAVKVHRKYYHHRLDEGDFVDTGERIKVTGPDIEDINYKLYCYKSDYQDMNYLYFDYMKQPGFVY